jgi:hypothetical protein
MNLRVVTTQRHIADPNPALDARTMLPGEESGAALDRRSNRNCSFAARAAASSAYTCAAHSIDRQKAMASTPANHWKLDWAFNSSNLRTFHPANGPCNKSHEAAVASLKSFDLWGQSEARIAKQSHLRQIAAWLEGEPEQETKSLRDWMNVDARRGKTSGCRPCISSLIGTRPTSGLLTVPFFRKSACVYPVMKTLRHLTRSPACSRLLAREETDLQPWATRIPGFSVVTDPEDRAFLIELRIHFGIAAGGARDEAETRKFLCAARGFLGAAAQGRPFAR